jgi:hypothetical protein
MSEPDKTPDLAKIRRRLALHADVETGLTPAIAAALLLLLPPIPVEDRHTVDDVLPRPTTEPGHPEWIFGTWQIAVRGDRGGLIEWRMTHPDIVWFTDPAEAEQFAAVLLSAAARARAQQETDRG